MTPETRENVIDTLIDWLFDSDDMNQLLEDILRNGYKGYNNMTNKELEDLYNQGLEEEETIKIL